MALVLLLVLAAPAGAQTFSSRGFGDVHSTVYPQVVPQDDNHFLVEGRFRIEPAVRAASWLTVTASLEARLDNLERVERAWGLDVRDRGLRRPALSLRHANANIRRGGVNLIAGRQFIRWGKADVLNPTDRFAPKDFLEVTRDEFLGVIGARVMYERGAHLIDGVVVPVFTPSRIPLPDSRWAPALPPGVAGTIDRGVEFPQRPQYGVRWNVLGAGFEMSVSFFDGFNHLPQFQTQPLPDMPALSAAEGPVLSPADGALVAVRRSYAPLRMAGMDAAVPLRWFVLKGEVAALVTSSEFADDVVLYVVQVERQIGELSLVGGYAGEIITTETAAFDYAPDRGLTRAFLGRAGYTVDANSDVSFEAAVRQNLAGVWIKGQYSKALDSHWRVTAAGAVIGGDDEDFIGQYRRNSHLLSTLRYSF